ncbi:hypothetical protein POM88_025111 [Heracleum sosnowskyi]|uniref:Uncharacterized protein n=1 Tax=Heracleum sosnowskyi TaxID=360622 RepID=A0AAD8I3E4_9APIA|nr:hypothetical protein POM88_025111 [Heracleum sosnowskyi]
MAKALHTLQSMFVLTLVFVMLAGLKQGFVEGQSWRLPPEEGQDLDGKPPPSLAKLRYIKQIDFTRNYLSGTIPPEWASTKLEYISFTVNRLSGPIPDYLGNISTLRYLEIQASGFEGPIPSSISSLSNLTELLINNLNGGASKFPQLGNMSKLKSLDLSFNNLAGDIHSDLSGLQSLETLLIDLSYNNFFLETQACRDSLNLFRSYGNNL